MDFIIKHRITGAQLLDKLVLMLNTLHPNFVVFDYSSDKYVDIQTINKIQDIFRDKMQFVVKFQISSYMKNIKRLNLLFKNEKIYPIVYMQEKFDQNAEKAFWYGMKLFQMNVGYVPYFAAYISSSTEQYVKQYVRLAKQLQTKVKLERSMTSKYPLWKFLQIVLDLLDEGHEEHLDFQNAAIHGSCDFNTNLLCSSTIRACSMLDGERILYAQCEKDLDNKIGMLQFEDAAPVPKQEDIRIDSIISKRCLACKLYRLCNGCKYSREIAKADPMHCTEMKKLEQRVLSYRWKL